MILYIGKKEMDFDAVNAKLKLLLTAFVDTISKDKN